MRPKRVIIMGAAGRDFHNFNVFFRSNPDYCVVAFTAAQIPGIAGRKYPKQLAGRRYPDGVPILPEERLGELVKKFGVDVVVLAYSDLSHAEVMHKASAVLAAGADFWLLGPKSTMLSSNKPVISVCAVRTGAGKSPAARRVIALLHRLRPGWRIAVIRHPMPYGNLRQQAVQRFATMQDLQAQNCTIEEMEEYAPHVRAGTVVYAGVDYEKVLHATEKEADVIVWDGGNNDQSFIKPDLQITVTDCRRPGHELSYHPGEANARTAHVVIINKADIAPRSAVAAVVKNIKALNPKAVLIKAGLRIFVDRPRLIRGKKVLVVEDGPTVTHGGLPYGAGYRAAKRHGCRVIDPRKWAAGSIRKAYEEYPHIGPVLPALGYSAKQMAELERTINAVPSDAVIIATPVNLSQFMRLNRPAVKVDYELREISRPGLENVFRRFMLGLRKSRS